MQGLDKHLVSLLTPISAIAERFAELNDDATYFFTTGCTPEWQTYRGMYVPVPLKIRTDRDIDIVRAGTDVVRAATDVLAQMCSH